jgi:hypothetical protein
MIAATYTGIPLGNRFTTRADRCQVEALERHKRTGLGCS